MRDEWNSALTVFVWPRLLVLGFTANCWSFPPGKDGRWASDFYEDNIYMVAMVIFHELWIYNKLVVCKMYNNLWFQIYNNTGIVYCTTQKHFYRFFVVCKITGCGLHDLIGYHGNHQCNHSNYNTVYENHFYWYI